MKKNCLLSICLCLCFYSEAISQYSIGDSIFLSENNGHNVIYTGTDSLKDSVHSVVLTYKTIEEPNFGGWISLGIGKCYLGLTSYYSFSFAYNANILTVRYLRADEVRFNLGGYDFDDPPMSIKEKGILYGRSYRKKYLVLSLSGGIGFIDGIDRGKKIREKEYEKVNISTYGVPFEAKFRIEIGFIGFGCTWFGNINNYKFLSGGLLEIYFGKF